MDFTIIYMKKLAEERYCNNCRYYLPYFVIINNKFYDIGGDCVNNNPYYPPMLIPSEVDGNCKCWESKYDGNGIPF